MDDSSFEDQLADDLKAVANELRTHRDVPDGPLLDRVLHRIRPKNSSTPRRLRLLTPRTAVIAILALAVVVGARLSNLNPVQTVATLAGTVTTTASTSPSGQAADDTYCPEHGGGWAPTFRSHYGAPGSGSPSNPQGWDDGWSPSVQPSCVDGSLKITWTDNITVPANAQLWAGYDFHRSAQQLYSVTVYNPKVILNLACASGSPSSSTFPYTWGNGSYLNPPQNYWTPDNNNKYAQSAFQSGGFAVPAVCGTKNGVANPVIVTGGAFYATVQAR